MNLFRKWTELDYSEAWYDNIAFDDAAKTAAEKTKQDLLEAWVKLARASAPNTPDIAILEQYEHQLLFVCDDLMETHPNHGYIHRGIPLFDAFTKDKFTFWKHKKGPESYPVPLRQMFGHNRPQWENSADPIRDPVLAPIKGQVWAIRPGEFIVLDAHKDQGVKFIRGRVKINVPWRTKLPDNMDRYTVENLLGFKLNSNTIPVQTTISVWMYMGIPDFWIDVIDGGFEWEPVRAFHLTDNEYYYWYSLKEYDGEVSKE